MALAKMQDRIMLCLPAPNRLRSLSESLSELKELKDQDEYLIGNVTVRNLLNGTVEMLCQLQAGSGPRLQGLGDKWSQRLHVALPLYCTAKAEDGAVQRGLDAFKLRMDACKKKEAAGKLMFDDLTDLHTFDFLATADLKEQLTKLTETLLKGTRTTTRRRGRDDDGAVASKEKKSKKAKKEKDNTTAAEVDALFNM